MLDGAILLVSAAEGIQAQTETLWKALTSLKIPTLLCVNKIDRTGVNLPEILESIREQFTPAILPLQGVTGEGSRETAVFPLSWTEGELYDNAVSLTADFDEEISALFLEDRPISQADPGRRGADRLRPAVPAGLRLRRHGDRRSGAAGRGGPLAPLCLRAGRPAAVWGGL